MPTKGPTKRVGDPVQFKIHIHRNTRRALREMSVATGQPMGAIVRAALMSWVEGVQANETRMG